MHQTQAFPPSVKAQMDRPICFRTSCQNLIEIGLSAMKKTFGWGLSALMALVSLASFTQAGSLPLNDATLLELVGENETMVAPVIEADLINDNLTAKMASTVFTGDNGKYAYLYQIFNFTNGGTSAVEMFTLFPFCNANDQTRIGVLDDPNANDQLYPEMPTQRPEEIGFVDSIETVSFYFTWRFGHSLNPGERSSILYVLSDNPPKMITGNVIGSAIADGEVYGPFLVPEAVSLAQILFVLFALFAWERRK